MILASLEEDGSLNYQMDETPKKKKKRVKKKKRLPVDQIEQGEKTPQELPAIVTKDSQTCSLPPIFIKSSEGFYTKKPSVIHEIDHSDQSNYDDLLLMFKDKGFSLQEAKKARKKFMS